MFSTTFFTGYRFPFAYVAFGGTPSHWWTHFLKKGFYHCFLVLGNGREWCIIDPVLHFTDLIIIKKPRVESFLKQKGYKLVRTTPHIPTQIKFFLRPCTCVENVRRLLGIQAPFLWTPYQLFCFLTQKKEKNP